MHVSMLGTCEILSSHSVSTPVSRRASPPSGIGQWLGACSCGSGHAECAAHVAPCWLQEAPFVPAHEVTHPCSAHTSSRASYTERSAHAGPCWSPTEGSAHPRHVLSIQCTPNHTGHMPRAQDPQRCPPRGSCQLPLPDTPPHTPQSGTGCTDELFTSYYDLGPSLPWEVGWARGAGPSMHPHFSFGG